MRKKWNVVPVSVSTSSTAYGLPVFVKDAATLFSVTEKQGDFEWTGTDNALVATEYVEDETCKLYVKKTLPREEVDALVALWCCRVWRHSATTNPAVDHGMEGGKYTDPLGLNSY